MTSIWLEKIVVYLQLGGLLPFLTSTFGRTLHACKNQLKIHNYLFKPHRNIGFLNELGYRLSSFGRTLDACRRQFMIENSLFTLCRSLLFVEKKILNASLGLLAAALVLSGCSLAPTKVYESKQGFSGAIQSKAQKPIQITVETVVVDCRTRFDHTMSHFPGSTHLLWESFAQTNGRFPGRLQEDLGEAKKRLILKGLHPQKPVVIIGYGQNGQGEAGRLAWTLLYMGFDDVQVVGDQVLNLSSNIVNTKPKPNAQDWTLKTRDQLVASKKQVMSAVTQSQLGAEKVYLIDVRSKDEYFQKSGLGKQYALPELGAIHIEWKEFFDSKGRPRISMKKQLNGVGIKQNSRVIVLSNQGVRSAAVNAALVSMGFFNSANFVDGLSSLKKY